MPAETFFSNGGRLFFFLKQLQEQLLFFLQRLLERLRFFLRLLEQLCFFLERLLLRLRLPSRLPLRPLPRSRLRLLLRERGGQTRRASCSLSNAA